MQEAVTESRRASQHAMCVNILLHTLCVSTYYYIIATRVQALRLEGLLLQLARVTRSTQEAIKDKEKEKKERHHLSSNCSSQEGGEEGSRHEIQQRWLSRVKLNHHHHRGDKAEDVSEYLRVEVNLLAL